MTQEASSISPPKTKASVPFSLGRVWTIAMNTFVEATRQKVFLIVMLVCVVILASSRLFTQFTFEDQLKIIKDIGLAVITVGGALIAIILTAQLLASEVENRTIYTILSKPVWRLEFLLGKFLGMVVLIFISVLIMSAVFTLVLFYMERVLINDAVTGAGMAADRTGLANMQQVVSQIQLQVRDPNLIKAVLLAFSKLVLLTAIAMFVASFSTSMIFTVFISGCIYFMGHLQSTAREMWQGQGTLLAKAGMALVAFFVPDLQSFNLADDIIVGNVITWGHTLKVVGYGAGMSALIMALAYAIFYYKEI
jgi:ABC-type Na+ efflux pump permease subunit